MKLEICANSYQSAQNAQEAGAHRIELCTELAVGGLTPSYGLIKEVIENLDIPVFVLIRPRSGNFMYSDSEFEIMKQDIQLCRSLGCSGIVSGVLHANNTVDIERTESLIEFSKPLRFTFHRAFDCVPNPIDSLEQLIDLGVDRVLTSGQEVSAEQGLELLKQLKVKANKNIRILPGSGINPSNAKLFKDSGFDEIHASASKAISSTDSTYFGSVGQSVSDVATIKEILKSIRDEI